MVTDGAEKSSRRYVDKAVESDPSDKTYTYTLRAEQVFLNVIRDHQDLED